MRYLLPLLLAAQLLCCTSLAAAASTYTNPVGDEPLHMGDPFAFLHDKNYYLVGTTASGSWACPNSIACGSSRPWLIRHRAACGATLWAAA